MRPVRCPFLSGCTLRCWHAAVGFARSCAAHVRLMSRIRLGGLESTERDSPQSSCRVSGARATILFYVSFEVF